jgi:hypothetical protein
MPLASAALAACRRVEQDRRLWGHDSNPGTARHLRRYTGSGGPYRCVRSNPRTKPYDFIGFGDVHAPKPCEFLGSRATISSHTPVVEVLRLGADKCGSCVLQIVDFRQGRDPQRRLGSLWVHVADFWAVFCMFNSRFGRSDLDTISQDRWTVRGGPWPPVPATSGRCWGSGFKF